MFHAPDQMSANLLQSAYATISSDWLSSVGLVPEGVYRFSSFPGMNAGVVWRLPNEATHLSLLFPAEGKPKVYISTKFADGSLLKTGTSVLEHGMPLATGELLQTFSTKRPEDLWQHHIQSRDKLMFRGAQPAGYELTFPTIAVENMKSQVVNVQKYLLWQVRVGAWALIPRYWKHNKPVVA